MDQQIVYVTGDGEFEISHLNEENEESKLAQDESEEREMQQIEVHVEQPEEAPETKEEQEEEDDLRLECEEESLEASPCKLVDRARLVNYPLPDPRQKRRMDSESKHLLAELLNLPLPSVLEKLRQLENLAHILSQQELTELTRAEVLNIL
ncbi:uncharacterized protein LOC100904004 [Galendromus occidentalis]|uniref:Uncharacterized protein LOC100904004 n=1 Tax=Galendromus occidentalis TaxID=34638 RepID=A0AAJ6QY14_9ACAR|nr:uncharacterized protein LOC100904004 [Galendromus occidentalis]